MPHHGRLVSRRLRHGRRRRGERKRQQSCRRKGSLYRHSDSPLHGSKLIDAPLGALRYLAGRGDAFFARVALISLLLRERIEPRLRGDRCGADAFGARRGEIGQSRISTRPLPVVSPGASTELASGLGSLIPTTRQRHSRGPRPSPRASRLAGRREAASPPGRFAQTLRKAGGTCRRPFSRLHMSPLVARPVSRLADAPTIVPARRRCS